MGFYNSATSSVPTANINSRTLNEFTKYNLVTISFAVNKNKMTVLKIESNGRNLFHTDLMVFI